MTTPKTALLITNYTLIMQGTTDVPLVIQSLNDPLTFSNDVKETLYTRLPYLQLDMILMGIHEQIEANRYGDYTGQVGVRATLVIKHHLLTFNGINNP